MSEGGGVKIGVANDTLNSSGDSAVVAVYRGSQSLMAKADEFLRQCDYCVAVILAVTATEVCETRIKRQIRTANNASSGTNTPVPEPKVQPFWDEYQKARDQRNNAAHEGFDIQQNQAEAAIKACLAFIQFFDPQSSAKQEEQHGS